MTTGAILSLVFGILIVIGSLPLMYLAKTYFEQKDRTSLQDVSTWKRFRHDNKATITLTFAIGVAVVGIMLIAIPFI